jgi:toxin-antitoxin system PIN domain toxin
VLAVDTNILVYAEVPFSQFHETARELVTRLVEEPDPWAIPWPCIYEFLRVVTHPRFFIPPVPLEIALRDLNRLLQSPSLHLLSETPRHAEILDLLLRESRVIGNLMFEGIAALCIEHGITEIITADRDFSRFPLKAANPFRS